MPLFSLDLSLASIDPSAWRVAVPLAIAGASTYFLFAHYYAESHIPGSYGFPVVGETLDFIWNPRQFVEKRLKRYGPTFKTSIFGNKVLFLTTDEGCRQAFRVEPKSGGVHSFETIKQFLQIGPTGKTHTEFRKNFAQFLNKGYLASVSPMFVRIIREEIDEWHRVSAAGRYIRAEDVVKNIPLSIILNMSIKDVSPEKKAEIFDLLADVSAGIRSVVASSLLSPTFAKGIRSHRRLCKIIEAEIHTIMPDLDALKDSNFMAQLISFALQHNLVSGSVSQARYVMGFWFAAFDTTSTTLFQLLYNLSLNPDVLAKIREEALAAGFSYQSDLTTSDLSNLKYTNAVIKETFRLRALGVMHMFRELHEPTELGGYQVPKGFLLTAAIHGNSVTSQESLEDGHRFKPERFLDGSVQATGTDLIWGAPPRVCGGMDIAMLELRATLVLLALKGTIKPKGALGEIYDFPVTHIKGGFDFQIV
ncbi:cytochrome P450 [Polychytrium aggregatum]|uniref:cytochrome P450 n=1 Tax=Polychytrium aggregatum TaxID=110093 RepID=UPI0022FE3738|nr:cytochrome P450 [Polychytrium aggregatum]KAI9203894.1 cytochrome P450 [Polychytrium aggregatum]